MPEGLLSVKLTGPRHASASPHFLTPPCGLLATADGGSRAARGRYFGSGSPVQIVANLIDVPIEVFPKRLGRGVGRGLLNRRVRLKRVENGF